MRLLVVRAAKDRPVRAGLIGAGKLGAMFLSQVPSTPGLEVTAIADLEPGESAADLPHGRLARRPDRRDAVPRGRRRTRHARRG
jgi:predicted homoserine dehydrogenase-like protein